MDVETIAQYGWRVSLSDDVRITDRHGADATPRLRKVRAVIAILASTPGHRVARRDVLALLWSDRGAEQARGSLRQCLFTLRSEVPTLAEADSEWVWLSNGAVILNENDSAPPTLARLAGIDPAMDHWLAARLGCTVAAPPVAARPPVAAPNFADHATPPRNRRLLLFAVAQVVLVAAAGIWWAGQPPPVAPPGLAIIEIAPFATAAPATSAIAERMRDDIRSLLPADRAVVRISHDGGSRSDAARREGVEWVISGSVETKDDIGRAHVQIETADGHAIWGRDAEAAAARIGDAAAIAATRIAMTTACALGGPHVHRDVDVLGLLFEACDRLDISTDNYNEEAALVALQRLANRAPGDALAQAYFGTGLAIYAVDMPPEIAQANRIESARRLDRAQRLDPRVGETWLGRYALVADDRAYALKESLLARGLAVEPNNPVVNGFMANVLATVGRGDEALVFSQRSMALSPARLALTRRTARLLSAAGRPREALAWLDFADRRFPRNGRQAMERLDVLLASGDTHAARALLDRAAEIPQFLEPEKEAAKRRLTYAMDAPHGALADTMARDAVAEADAKPGVAPRDFGILTQLGRTEAALLLAQRHPLPPEVFFRLQSRPVLLSAQFPALAHRAGLWDYWQHSGHWPDICREPQLQWRCGPTVKSASFAE